MKNITTSGRELTLDDLEWIITENIKVELAPKPGADTEVP